MRLRNRRDLRKLEQRILALAERTPGLDVDAVVRAEGGDLRLLVGRVQLDLVDRGNGVGLGDQPLEVRHHEVRDADAPGLAVLANLLERTPGLDIAVLRRGRPVDQVQVDLLEPELVEAACHGVIGRLGALVVVVELGGDEEFVARDSGCRDRAPDALLVADRWRPCRCAGSRSRGRRRRSAPPRPGRPGRRRSRAAESARRR